MEQEKGVADTLQLLKDIVSDDEEHVQHLAKGLPLIMHDLLPDDAKADDQFWVGLEGMVKEQPSLISKVLGFVEAWVKTGRRLRRPLKIAMKMWLSALPSSPERRQCLAAVEEEIEDYSPVLGRWKAKTSPRDNMLYFLTRTPQQICNALTAMCLPFFRLRACEFNEKSPGPHLKDLNERYKSVTGFVKASILVAASNQRKLGITVYEHWLSTAHELHFMRKLVGAI